MTTGCILLLCGLAGFQTGCASRYRLDLFVTDDSGRSRIKTEKALLTPGTVLNNPYADTRIILGKGNTVVVEAGKRGSHLYKAKANVLSFDEYLRLRIYLQLPETLAPDRVELVDNAYVIILERYDRPVEEKVFLPVSGQIAIDSITTRQIFLTLNGEFKNSNNTPLSFDGKFKLSISD